MNIPLHKTLLIVLFLAPLVTFGQVDSTEGKQVYDVVILKDGSRLTGTILKWELSRGMEFKLVTGTTMIISRSEIDKVHQAVDGDTAFTPPAVTSSTYHRGPREPLPYAFKEKGLYHTFSCFFNISDPGGVGLSYSIGHRLNRMLGLGGGFGIETNDFFNNRDQIPLFVEARGFLKAEKITPYYAMKLGYAFPMTSDFTNNISAKGGIYVSPELGIRFGARTVTCYAGIEYKLMKASYTDFIWDGGTATDEITYRRLEVRTGIAF